MSFSFDRDALYIIVCTKDILNISQITAFVLIPIELDPLKCGHPSNLDTLISSLVSRIESNSIVDLEDIFCISVEPSPLKQRHPYIH